MNRREILELISGAFNTLRVEEPEILAHPERTLTPRLHTHLDRVVRDEPRLDGFVVDAEYQRAGQAVKRFGGYDAGGQAVDRKIVPDLILHRRDAADDPRANLLALEVKTGPGPWVDHDRAKLAVLSGRDHWVGVNRVERRTSYFRIDGVPRLPQPRDVPPRQVNQATAHLPPGIWPYEHAVLLHLSPGQCRAEWIDLGPDDESVI